MGTIISHYYLPLILSFYFQLYGKMCNPVFFSFMIMALPYTVTKNYNKIDPLCHIFPLSIPR